jgi:nucleoside-diphosphate-sugar epimerase
MHLLLTGASGFLGRNVLLRAPADWQIVALYARDQGFPAFVAGLNRPNVTAVKCDLGNLDDTTALIREHGAEWDACLYLAGKVDIPWSVRAPKDDLLANTVPLLNLLEGVQADKFVYFSSGAVYDGLIGEVSPDARLAPTLPYAISKLASERYLHFHHRRRHSIGNYLVVRFFGAYGPYEAPHKIYSRLIHRFAVDGDDRYTIYGDGTNLIDAMFVDDAVDAIERMLTGDHWNDTVNLAGGCPVTVEELVRAVGKVLGLESVRIEKQGTANERNDFWGSVREMKELYGFAPRVSLADGVSRFRDFLLAGHHVA